MNFFQQLAGLELVGNLKIVIKQGNPMVVSVMLDNEKCGDDARKHLTPLLLRGSAEDLDAGFFTEISKPLTDTNSLLVNMESYLKQKDTAKKNSSLVKEQGDQEKNKKKAFDEIMKQVDALEKQKKYKEAIALLPKESDYPDQAATIDAKRKALTPHTVQSTIFDMLPDHLEAEQKANESADDDEDESDNDRMTDEDFHNVDDE